MVKEKINSFWGVVLAVVSGPFRMLDEFMLVRRLLLVAGAYAQADAIRWSYEFANAANAMTGADKALVIAAVLTPVSTLFGAVVKFYNEGRKPATTE